LLTSDGLRPRGRQQAELDQARVERLHALMGVHALTVELSGMLVHRFVRGEHLVASETRGSLQEQFEGLARVIGEIGQLAERLRVQDLEQQERDGAVVEQRVSVGHRPWIDGIARLSNTDWGQVTSRPAAPWLRRWRHRSRTLANPRTSAIARRSALLT
jgi:hypothetical protein